MICFNNALKLDPLNDSARKYKESTLEKVVFKTVPSTKNLNREIGTLLNNLKNGPVFMWLGFICIIGAITSLIVFIISLFSDSINVAALVSFIINLISGIAWFTIIRKFEETAKIIETLIKKVK